MGLLKLIQREFKFQMKLLWSTAILLSFSIPSFSENSGIEKVEIPFFTIRKEGIHSGIGFKSVRTPKLESTY